MAVGDDRNRQATRSAERGRRRDREVLLLGGDRVYALQCRRVGADEDDAEALADVSNVRGRGHWPRP
ncbi:MAG: hypothetical protein WB557_28820, partial [Solirubrobacteraceae bacterium]